MPKFKVGDIVRYTTTFLRNICWYTGVPINGRVEKRHKGGSFASWPYVSWHNADDGDKPELINPVNLELDIVADKNEKRWREGLCKMCGLFPEKGEELDKRGYCQDCILSYNRPKYWDDYKLPESEEEDE